MSLWCQHDGRPLQRAESLLGAGTPRLLNSDFSAQCVLLQAVSWELRAGQRPSGLRPGSHCFLRGPVCFILKK